MISLQTLVAEVKNLKPIPAVAGQLLAVADHSNIAMADIAKVIEYDPVITAAVLRTCNSAYFGMKHPVESIKDAVNLLGIDQVIGVALVRSGSQVLGGSQTRIDEFMKAGAAGYITKPFTAAAVRDAIVPILGEPYYEDVIDESDEDFDF